MISLRTLGSFILLLFLVTTTRANDCTSATTTTIGSTSTTSFDSSPDFFTNSQHPCDPPLPVLGDAWFELILGGTNAVQANVGFDITTNFNGFFNVYLLYSETFEMGDACFYPGTTGSPEYTGLTRYQSFCNVNILGGPGNVYEFDNAGLDGSGHFFVVVESISGNNNTGTEQVSITPVLNGTCPAPANDNCANAIPLTVGNGLDPDYLIPTIPAWSDALKGTNSCATKERITATCAGGPPPPTEDHYGQRFLGNCYFGGNIGDIGTLIGGAVNHCDSYLENTVWYSFTVPAGAPSFGWQLHVGGNALCSQEPNNLVVMLLRNVSCTNANQGIREDCDKFGYSTLIPSALGTLDGGGFGMTLNAGQTYYIVVDGTRASQCDFCLLLTRSVVNPVLPATVENFSGWNKGPTNVLNWETSEEINHDYFAIERSLDGKNFEIIGNVNGIGESNTTQNYQFEDRNAPFGNAFYRLSIVDINGMSFFSSVTEVFRAHEKLELHKAYPVPFQESLNLYYSTPSEQPLNIRMIDIHGKVVLQKQFATRSGTQELSLDTQNLASGMYVLQMEQDGRSISRKVVK